MDVICSRLLLLCVISTAVAEFPIPDEQLLYENLMHRYQKSVRPVINASDILTVKFDFRLIQIVGLDERQQVLTTNVFIDQKWIDENLSWRPEDYNEIRSLRVAGNNVWLPDTFIFNNADDSRTGFLSSSFVQIHNDGSVKWPLPVKLKSSCKVDIVYFPFDDQQCILKFGSWIYSGTWVDYVEMFNDSISNMEHYVDNSEWELLSMRMEKNILQFSSNGEGHPDLTFVLHIRRKTLYYKFNIIVPCIMLSILTLLTFWLPPTSGEKVTLGLNVFLAFSMFMLLVAEQVPATSEAVPLIGIYLCVVMTMTSVSVITAVIVINVYNRGMKMRRAPAWLRTFALSWMSKLLWVKHDIPLVAKHVILEDHFYEVTKRPDHASQIRKSYSKFDVSKQPNSPIFTRHNNNSEVFQSVRQRQSVLEQEQESWKLDNDQLQAVWRRQESIRRGESPACSTAGSGEDPSQSESVPSILIQSPSGSHLPQVKFPNQNSCSSQSGLPARVSPQTGYPSGTTAQAVRYEETPDPDQHQPSQQLPHMKKIVVAEWQRIAVVVDRFLFWFYFIVTFTMYVIILIIVPAQHKVQVDDPPQEIVFEEAPLSQ